MARTVAAEASVALEPEKALELWSDTDRWASFVEGFARLVERSPEWPAEGARVVWESGPAGRGRVTEKITGRGPGEIRSQVFEERFAGEQTVRSADGRFAIRLDYALTDEGPLAGLTDALFIRRALRDMLRRTVSRFAVEAEEEARLR
jgi:hypothetical protein